MSAVEPPTFISQVPRLTALLEWAPH